MRYRVLVCSCFGAILLAAVRSEAAADRNNLWQALQARYEAKPGQRGYAAVGSNGPILAVAQQGISAGNPSQSLIIPTNKVVNGRIVPLGAMSQSSMQNGGRVLDVGEPVQVARVEVKNDEVKITFATCSVCENGAPAFTSALLFAFPKGSLDSANAEDVERSIETYLAFPQQAAQGNAPPPAPAQSAPPPAPAESTGPPPTISLGQTIDQVVATLGQPLQIIDLGSKKTYKYKDLKVIFTDGKVTDVQ